MQRVPPRIGFYPEAGIELQRFKNNGDHIVNMRVDRITAEQAREAAHLLNQLAEYLESC